MVQTDKERNFSASGDRNIWVHLNATFGNPLYFVPTYIPWAFCKTLPCYIYRDIVWGPACVVLFQQFNAYIRHDQPDFRFSSAVSTNSSCKGSTIYESMLYDYTVIRLTSAWPKWRVSRHSLWDCARSQAACWLWLQCHLMGTTDGDWIVVAISETTATQLLCTVDCKAAHVKRLVWRSSKQ